MPCPIRRKLMRESAATIYSGGKPRSIIIELEPAASFIRLRLKGNRTAYPLGLAELYRLAARQAIVAAKAARVLKREAAARDKPRRHA